MLRILFPLITSLLFSGSYIAGKYTTVDLDPLTTTLARFAIALGFLALLAMHFRLRALKIALRDIPWMMLLGATGIVTYHYFFFLSLRFTDVANTAIINALSPVVTAFTAAILIGEWLSQKNYLGLGFCFLAVLTLLCEGEPRRLISWDFNRGDLFMLAAVGSWTIYAIVVKRLSSRYSSYTVTFYATLFGVGCLLVLVPLDEAVVLLKQSTPATRYAVLYMGVFGSGIGYLTYNLSVRHIGATRTSSFVYSVIPILVAVFAWVLLGQGITGVMVASAVMILLGLRLMMNSRASPSLLQG